MTKKVLLEEVTKLLVENKVKETSDLYKGLIELVAPKSGGGVVQNPIKVVDGTNYHFCRYTELYLPESEMVMSKNKSKGYSKKAIAHWTKAGRDASKMNEEAMKLLLSKKIEEGTKLAQEAEELKLLRNKPEFYSDIVKEYKSIALES